MQIKNELENRAQIFNKALATFLGKGYPETLYAAVRHLPIEGGGKRLRPSLAILSGESVNGDVHQTIPFAIALELIHNFTLVHDDIMDHSSLRRNVPTVHIKFGEPTAILAGDLLFAKAFESLKDYSNNPQLFHELYTGLVHCVLDICTGQQLDMEFENKTAVTEQEYIDMITKKTAVLFGLATRGGALIGHANKQEIKALTDYGNSLGLAFQIWDDFLDMSSDEETLGKDIGNDIRNGKKTLIAVHAWEHATSNDKNILRTIFGNKNASESDIKKVFSLFDSIGSITYVKKTAQTYSLQAIKALDVLRDTKAKMILKELAEYSITREK